MPSLEIIKSGLLTSIQDRGRKGMAYYAIPRSGAMDANAAKIALLLLHLAEDSPLIECTSIAPHIRFHDATQIAIAGADFSWTINNTPVQVNAVIEVQPGDVLRGKMARDGFRAYIAINGRLQLEPVYDSYATYMNAKLGGHQGRLLQKGDVIEWEEHPINSLDRSHVPILLGPEYDFLSAEAQQQLVTQEYLVSSDSNRMGLRLQGDPLESSAYQLAHSVPILPGFIQLPPSGLPIIILQDGQISGGYPRIAYVPSRYLAALNQIPLGGRFRFRMV